MNLIGLSGKKGSGKSTVATILQQYLTGYQQVLFAGKLKQIVGVLTGVDPINFEDQDFKLLPSKILDNNGNAYTYRQLLQLTGTNLFRDGLSEQVWVDSLFSSYQQDEKWIVTDMRFPNELTAIKERGGITIRVNRPGLPYDPHPSECALDNAEFDYVIENDGTLEELEEKVKQLVNHLIVS